MIEKMGYIVYENICFHKMTYLLLQGRNVDAISCTYSLECDSRIDGKIITEDDVD